MNPTKQPRDLGCYTTRFRDVSRRGYGLAFHPAKPVRRLPVFAISRCSPLALLVQQIVHGLQQVLGLKRLQQKCVRELAHGGHIGDLVLPA